MTTTAANTVKVINGKIQLSEQALEALGLEEGDQVLIKVTEGKIELSKVAASESGETGATSVVPETATLGAEEWQAYLAIEEKYEGVFRRLA
jgi:bifunctional DNA-binding transcriptional regulator/antitoxin component of YhaV-PrlF toxin-antitoxin module